MLRRALFLGWFAILPLCLAQPSGQEKGASEETETRNEPDFKWHLANTAIFFALAGYALVKVSPSFFNARSADIQRAIQEATGLKLQAEFRSSEMDRKMATLPDAVAQMRGESKTAMEREHERRQSDTADAIARIRASTAGEIENMRQDGARRIRNRAARVALRLAEQRLREQSSSTGNAGSIADFLHLIERGRN